MKGWVLLILLLASIAFSAFSTESQDACKELSTFILPNGMRICLKKLSGDEEANLLVRALAPGGCDVVSESHLASVRIAPAVAWESGIGAMDGQTLGRFLLGKQMQLSLETKAFSRMIEGSASFGREEELFQLIHLLFCKPRLEEDALEKVRVRWKESVQLRAQDPEVAFEDAVCQLNTQNLAALRSLSEQDLDNADLNVVKNYYLEQFLTTTDWTFVIVGRFDMPAMKNLVMRYLGSIPRRHAAKKSRPCAALAFAPGWQRQTLAHEAVQECQTRMTLPLHLELTPNTMAMLDFATQVLETRLRNAMRETTGSTLGVDVAYELPFYPYLDSPVLMLHFRCEKNKNEQSTALVMEKLQELCREGPSEEECRKASLLCRRNDEFWQGHRSYWLALLSNSLVWEWPGDALQEAQKKLQREGVQVKELTAFLQRHVVLDRGAIVTMQPN